MSKQKRRDFVWAGMMMFAIGFFGLCGYEMTEHKFMMADEEALSG
jgi:hypothetical protein